MATILKRISCVHRKTGEYGPAVEIFCVTTDGKRRSMGRLCRRCISAWGPAGLADFSKWHLITVMASQPKLGSVQLVYDGIEAIYSSEQRAELLRELDGQLRTWSKLPERADIRDLGWTVPSAELELRITFKV